MARSDYKELDALVEHYVDKEDVLGGAMLAKLVENKLCKSRGNVDGVYLNGIGASLGLLGDGAKAAYAAYYLLRDYLLRDEYGVCDQVVDDYILAKVRAYMEEFAFLYAFDDALQDGVISYDPVAMACVIGRYVMGAQDYWTTMRHILEVPVHPSDKDNSHCHPIAWLVEVGALHVVAPGEPKLSAVLRTRFRGVAVEMTGGTKADNSYTLCSMTCNVMLGPFSVREELPTMLSLEPSIDSSRLESISLPVKLDGVLELGWAIIGFSCGPSDDGDNVVLVVLNFGVLNDGEPSFTMVRAPIGPCTGG